MTYQDQLIQWKKEREDIYWQYKEGKPLYEIAYEYKVSTEAIKHRIKKFEKENHAQLQKQGNVV